MGVNSPTGLPASTVMLTGKGAFAMGAPVFESATTAGPRARAATRAAICLCRMIATSAGRPDFPVCQVRQAIEWMKRAEIGICPCAQGPDDLLLRRHL